MYGGSASCDQVRQQPRREFGCCHQCSLSPLPGVASSAWKLGVMASSALLCKKLLPESRSRGAICTNSVTLRKPHEMKQDDLVLHKAYSRPFSGL